MGNLHALPNPAENNGMLTHDVPGPDGQDGYLIVRPLTDDSLAAVYPGFTQFSAGGLGG